MEIAGYLGVRPAAELGLLRAARGVLVARCRSRGRTEE